MKYSLRQNRGPSRYQPYPGLGGKLSQSSQSSSQSTPSNSRPAKLTRCNAMILDQNSRYADSATTAAAHSTETTTSFDSAVPPPDTPTLNLTTASGTTDSTTFNSSEVPSSTTSFETAAGDSDDNESCLSLPVDFPTKSLALQPTSIDLPFAFKNSIRKAVRRRLKRYAGKLDPNTSREVELGITEAVDLAIRILERTHRPQDALPLLDTFLEVTTPSVSARPPPAIRPSFLRDVTKSVLQGSLNVIRFSGRQILTVLRPRTAPELTYEMTRLDGSISRAQGLIPGGWDRN